MNGSKQVPENWPPIGVTVQADVPCPVCEEVLGQVIAHHDRNGEPLKTVGCTRCGLMRTDPLPTGEDLRHFYQSEYRRSYKGSHRPKAKHICRAALLAAERLRRLSSQMADAVKVLDIGCASGEWLYLLQERGHTVTGVELDPAFGEFGRLEYGVDIRTEPVESLQLPVDGFDRITMFHVLEHIPDPVETLKSIHRWLSTDGLFIVEVPNVNSPHQNPAKRFHYAHVVGFTKESLATAFERSGWECLELSLDRYERNILAIVRRRQATETADPGLRRWPDAPPAPLVTSQAALARYYLRPTTYLRWLERMSQFLAEFRLVSKGKTPREVLQAVASRSR